MRIFICFNSVPLTGTNKRRSISGSLEENHWKNHKKNIFLIQLQWYNAVCCLRIDSYTLNEESEIQTECSSYATSALGPIVCIRSAHMA